MPHRAPRNVLDYGAIGSGSSTAADTAGIKAAIAACGDGDLVLIPRSSAFYSFDTSGGQSDAAVIDKAITIRIEGTVRATDGAVKPNPPTVFRVIAASVTFAGTGTLTGPGTTDDVNGPPEAELPSLVRVEGNSFTVTGLTIDTPPKIGIYLWGCHDARILNNTFVGGPTAYSDTGYFAIRANHGGRHIIANNQFRPDARGGMYVNCIFFNGTAWSTIESNVCHWPYEKLCYIVGSYNVVTRNTVIGRAPTDPNGGIIPGTNHGGTLGAVYRVDGQFNTVRNNSSQYGGGVQSIGGRGTIVSGNTFLDCGQGGIAIYGGAVDLSDIRIEGNHISCGNLTGVVVADGILVRPATSPAQGPNRNIQILDNVIKGFSKSDPLANVPRWQPATAYTRHHLIQPAVANGCFYTTDGRGTSGESAPTWPTSSGATVPDGSITWVCRQPEINLYAQIRLQAPEVDKEAVGCVIAGNQLIDGERGISTSRMHNSRVFDNRFQATKWVIVEDNGSNNQYANPTQGASNIRSKAP